MPQSGQVNIELILFCGSLLLDPGPVLLSFDAYADKGNHLQPQCSPTEIRQRSGIQTQLCWCLLVFCLIQCVTKSPTVELSPEHWAPKIPGYRPDISRLQTTKWGTT